MRTLFLTLIMSFLSHSAFGDEGGGAGAADNDSKVSLPKFFYLTEECSICFEDIYRENIFVTDCGHNFHKDCIEEALRLKSNCPNCRNVIHSLFAIKNFKEFRTKLKNEPGVDISAYLGQFDIIGVEKIRHKQLRDNLISLFQIFLQSSFLRATGFSCVNTIYSNSSHWVVSTTMSCISIFLLFYEYRSTYVFTLRVGQLSRDMYPNVDFRQWKMTSVHLVAGSYMSMMVVNPYIFNDQNMLWRAGVGVSIWVCAFVIPFVCITMHHLSEPTLAS